jgi:ketosteroid isomerase-like protein
MELLMDTNRDEIGSLIHRYCFHFDQNEPEAVAALFTEDATIDYGPEHAPIVGRAAIAPTIAVGLSERFRATSHHVSNIEITFAGEDDARSVSYLYAWHEYVDGSESELWGRYVHRFRRDGGQWLIAELVLQAAGTRNFHRSRMHPIGRRA